MSRRVLASLLSLVSALFCACDAKTDAPASTTVPKAPSVRASATASTTVAPELASATPSALVAAATNPVFPLVPGATFTFRGKRPDGSDDTWTAVLFVIDSSKGLFQYDPHNHVATWFTKAGFRVDDSGIQIVGESLAGDPTPAPALAVAFPITKAAAHDVPSLFDGKTKYTVEKRESVSVPAGKFDAWKISIQDKLNPDGAAWIAPGTGLVKIQLPSGRVDELVSFEFPKE